MSANYQAQTAKGVVWMLLFKWVERGLGFISTLMLVRLLTPADFGMVSMALSFIFMAEMLAAFSFDVALIQNPNATRDHYNSAWTANVMLGSGIAIGMLALALPISHFYKQPSVLPVICVLALGPLTSALENIGVVAFRKELDFRKEFTYQVTRKVIGFCVTIPLAFTLRSYWALVAGILASKLGGTVMSYWVHPFRPRFSFKELMALLHFSKWLLLNNLVNFLKERSTDFLIGRFFGPAPLGIYNVNKEFASLPANEMGMPMNRALLPGFAKTAGDLGAFRSMYTGSSALIALIAIPAGAGIFAVAHYLVPVALGKQWLSGVPVMEILSLQSSIMVFHGTIVTALVALGKPAGATKISALFVLLLVAGVFALTGKFGPLGAAIAVLAATIITTPLYLMQLKAYGGVPFSNFLRVTLRPWLASGVMIAVVRLALPHYDIAMSNAYAGLMLGVGVAVGGVTYALSLGGIWLALGRPAGPETQLIDQVRSRAPAWMPVIGRKPAA